MAQQGKLTFTFDQTDHSATMLFADDGVGFPIAETFFGCDDFGPLFDADAIRDFTAEIVFSVPFSFFLFAGDAEFFVECSAFLFVLPDVLINSFMTDRWAVVIGIELHSPGNLFGRMLLADFVFDIANGLRSHFDSFACMLTSLD